MGDVARAGAEMTWGEGAEHETVSGALSFLKFVCTDGLIKTILGIVGNNPEFNHLLVGSA